MKVSKILFLTALTAMTAVCSTARADMSNKSFTFGVEEGAGFLSSGATHLQWGAQALYNLLGPIEIGAYVDYLGLGTVSDPDNGNKLTSSYLFYGGQALYVWRSAQREHERRWTFELADQFWFSEQRLRGPSNPQILSLNRLQGSAVQDTHEHKKRVDTASLAILALTLFLFLTALYEKGLSREILLEAGVFLVSVKLVLASVKTDLANQSIEEKLDRLLAEKAKK
jgi:hypothetical protein